MIDPNVLGLLVDFASQLVKIGSGEGFLVFDRDLSVLEISDSLVALFGVTRALAVGRNALDVLPFLRDGGEADRLQSVLRGVTQDTHTVAFPSSLRGEPGLLEVRYVPFGSAGHEVPFAVGVVRDVGKKREAEQRIRETEERFRNMADAAPVLLWMSRADALCTFFNESWLRFTGRTQEEEWGVGWAEGIHFEDLQRCLDTYIDAFNAREVFEMEYRLRRADGEYRWILDRGTPRHLPDGTFAGYIGSCIDITERKNLESELRQALRVKGDFLDLVSHELRTPVAGLQLLIERLGREGTAAFSPRQRDTLERMVASTNRITYLISTVLHYSRIEGGRLRPDIRRFDLVELARGTLEEMRAEADRKNLELCINAEPGLPPLNSDPDLVRMILTNLLTNAIKFTEQGSVNVTLGSERAACRLSVIDTGRGVAPEEQARIFEPFEQVEPTRRKHVPGFGLGLSLVRGMTQALGGDVSVISELGKGAAFTVRLPLGDG